MSNKIMLEIEDLRDKRRTAEQAREKAGRARTIGLLGLLIGLVLMVSPLAIVGVLLVLAGTLAAFTQFVQGNHQKKMIAYYDQELARLRGEVV